MAGWMKNLQCFWGKPAIMLCFILCALPVVVMTALIVPPGQSPDETAHLARAAGLLHGAILGVRKNGIDPNTGKIELLTGVKVDTGLLIAAFDKTTEIEGRAVMTAGDFSAMRARPPDHDKAFADLPNTATYFPVAYVPATLGLALGLAVHASPFVCFMLARFAGLLAFLALGVLTLWIAAFGEALLLTVLLMPMTLFLAGTVNQDGVLAAMVCLACAALTRNSRGYRLLGLVVFALFLMAKPPYSLMLGVFLLPLFGPGFWVRVRDVAMACVPVLVWVVEIAAFVIVPFDRPIYHPGALYAGDRGILLDHANTAMNLHILLSPPARLITLPWHTARILGAQELREMIGVLGPLQINLSGAVYRLWSVCGIAALAGLVFSRRPVVFSPGAAAVNFLSVGFLVAVTCWLMMIMFYLSWTNVGLDYIDGLQGRYLLPLLPFLLLAVPGFRWRFNLPPFIPAIPTIAMGLYDIGYLPIKLVWNYYLH
jgi:hypothetical protein